MVMVSPRRRSHSTSRVGGVSPGQTCNRSVIGGLMSYSIQALPEISHIGTRLADLY
jgi:hypothetical protein